MNNLLRTLTESRVKPTGDLKLLLTAVKETRRQSYDAKISDAFYDSLENLLADLRTITIDNRDAEAFLKPVSRQEAPDYYDYITNPMDFATMARKLKNKQYKSKREFKDDLELIWSNCYKYNATEDHPLRPCAGRLRAKAERLLKYITDRKDRTDPPIPFDLSPPQPGIARPKTNGMLLNGSSGTTTVVRKGSPSTAITVPAPMPSLASSSSQCLRRLDLPFAESPALVRTPGGMVLFRDLDRGLGDSPSRTTLDKLKHIVPFPETESADSDSDDLAMALGGVTGDKRKLNGSDSSLPRKRARFAVSALPDDLTQLWWDAVQTDSLIANGLPEIPFASSSSLQQVQGEKKPKRRKRGTTVSGPKPAKSMLGLMNNNIKAMRRVRQTHAKLSALVATMSGPDDPDAAGDGGSGGLAAGPSTSIGTIGGLGGVGVHFVDDEVGDEKIDERHWTDMVKRKKGKLQIGEENANGCVRWVGEKILEHAGFQGTSKSAMDVLTGVFSEYLLNVGRSIRFLADKYSKTMTPEEIILHTLFESGVSKIQELDKYISDDIERHGVRLLELEKKLASVYRESTAGQEALEDEGLFEEEEEEEAGALAIGDFADALGEDYLGFRELGIAAECGLSTLSIPKSLLKRKKAQKMAIAKPAEKPLDYPLPPSFTPFTYSTLDDQIGLLKPFYQARFEQIAATRPPPPVQLSVTQTTLTNLPGPLQPPRLPGPVIAPYPPNPYPSTSNQTQISDTTQPVPPTPPTPPPQPAIPPDLELLDDPVPYLQAKMGPLGQIAKPNYAVASSKKKAKPVGTDDTNQGAGAGGGGGGGGGVSQSGGSGTGGGNASAASGSGSANGAATFIPTIVGPNGLPAQLGPDGAPKKKKGAVIGVGLGTAKKRKDAPPGLVLPLSPAASPSANGGPPPQHSGQPFLSPAVATSA